MKVRFAIDSTGTVAAVEIVDSGVVSAAVDACVRSEMERWTFCTCRGAHSRRVRLGIYRRTRLIGLSIKFALIVAHDRYGPWHWSLTVGDEFLGQGLAGLPRRRGV